MDQIVTTPARPASPWRLVWIPVWLAMAVVVYIGAEHFFRQLAIDHPNQIDGILTLVVFLLGGLTVGSWLFLDQGGTHNLKWYLLIAAFIAATVVGVQHGKDANSEAGQQSPAMFKDSP